MKRRQFLSGVSVGAAALAGCNSPEGQSSRRVTIPSLSLVNHEPRPATVTVVLTDSNDALHLWQTVELTGRRADGTVDDYEFDADWLEPRDYQLLLRWQEVDETYSNRLANLRFVEDCAPLTITLDDSFQFSVSLDACPDTE
jgi:hypothetical protein